MRNKRRIELHIESLVVDSMAKRDLDALRFAVESGLSAQLAPCDAIQWRDSHQDAIVIRRPITRALSPSRLGGEIAGAVMSTLNGEGERRR